jgi:hypothetical protein
MNIDDITIKQARELANMFAAPKPINATTERPVIVRSRDAGCAMRGRCGRGPQPRVAR